MQPYPNSWTTAQMNMGMNPNFNPYGQIQNPYMDRMNQLQQYQQNLAGTQMSLPSNQQPQPQGLIGKIVNDVSMVSPNDVPMDGNVAVFPKNDMSEIYCKQWQQDGTIQTVVYRPYIEQDGEQATNTSQTDFNALNEDIKALRGDMSGWLNELFGKIEQLEKTITVPMGKQSGFKEKRRQNNESNDGYARTNDERRIKSTIHDTANDE